MAHLTADQIRQRCAVSPFRVVHMTGMETTNGYAFRATVVSGDTRIGEIENQGNGGGSWFRGDNRQANEAFRAWVATFDGDTYDLSLPHQPDIEPLRARVDHETLCEALVDVYEGIST